MTIKVVTPVVETTTYYIYKKYGKVSNHDSATVVA